MSPNLLEKEITHHIFDGLRMSTFSKAPSFQNYTFLVITTMFLYIPFFTQHKYPFLVCGCLYIGNSEAWVTRSKTEREKNSIFCGSGWPRNYFLVMLIERWPPRCSYHTITVSVATLLMPKATEHLSAIQVTHLLLCTCPPVCKSLCSISFYTHVFGIPVIVHCNKSQRCTCSP